MNQKKKATYKYLVTQLINIIIQHLQYLHIFQLIYLILCTAYYNLIIYLDLTVSCVELLDNKWEF